jgi:pyrroline-5-carboxylate reductase
MVFRSKTIAVIGAGHLGTATIDALYKRGHRNIIATRTNRDALDTLAQTYDILTTTDNRYAAREADVLILSVKPYLIEAVAREVREFSSGKLVISLAAAKRLDWLEGILESRVARVMTGIFVHAERAMYATGTRCTAEDESAVRYIFGNAIRVDEELLAHRTWIACDTGLMAATIEKKVEKLSELGMHPADARACYAATLHAIAERLATMTGEEIYNNVAGKNSFTAELRKKLEEQKHFDLLQECIEETVRACR